MPPKTKKSSTQTRAEKVRDEINSVLGAGTLKMGNDPSLIVTFIPTGVLPLDVMLDGGLPRGRFTEIYGDYSTLKSYVALSAIAETQANGGVAALIDTEHAYDPEWAEAIGVDTKQLILPPYDQITTGEEAVDVMQNLVAADADLVVWDSIAATYPQDEAKKRLSKENIQPARLAALMSTATRRINAVNRKTAILCINQTRMKVGIMFGNPESVPGGKSMPFFASYRIALRKAGRITDTYKSWDGEKNVTSKRTIAQKIRCELMKSKLSSPEREAWFTWDLINGEIDLTGYLIAFGLEDGFIQKGSGTWKMNGKTFRGEAALRGYLDSNPKVKSKMREAALAGSRAVAKA